MGVGQKKVGFYRPIIIDDKENRHEVKGSDFWAKTHKAIGELEFKARRVPVNAAPFHGEVGLGTAPAVKYIRLGRVRYASDWPELLDDHAEKVEVLDLPNGRNLFECAYLVPFGTINRVALMGPLRGIVTVRQVETWLGAMLGLPTKGHRLELAPEVDSAIYEKLTQSEGVTRIEVRVPKGADLELPSGEKTGAEAALDEAVQAAGDKLITELIFSAGHGQADAKTRSRLKKAAVRLARATGVDRLHVTMTTESKDSSRLKSSGHDLFRDLITATAKFDVDDHTQLEVDEVLTGIQEAIQDFQKSGA